MSTMKKRSAVMSPCVSICALDDDDICIGCLRSGQEIIQWGKVDDEGKRQIMSRVQERLKQHT